MDFFSYYRAEDGKYIITKNGDYFLTCSGSEDEAKNIVRLLQEDSEK